MKFLKKFKLIDGIYSFNISSEVTNLVKDFYYNKPFPNYSSSDNKYSILEKGNKNYLAKSFKKNWLWKKCFRGWSWNMSAFAIF